MARSFSRTLSRPLRHLVTVALILLAPLIVIRQLQDHLLYYPEPMAREAYLQIAATSGLEAWPSTDALRGLAMPKASGMRGAIAVLHGNGGLAIHRDYYARVLAPLGYRVVLLEYPKYGPRPGKLGEAAFVADAAESLRLLRAETGGPLLLVGESLGAGVAAAVAKAVPETLDALILITPWDSLATVASHYYPWLPVRLLLADRYDSVENLKDFGKPILLLVAERDEIIPPRFADRLAQRLGSKARRVLIAGAGHNDWPEHLDTNQWRIELAPLLLTGNATGDRAQQVAQPESTNRSSPKP